jgi:hypothetical protein
MHLYRNLASLVFVASAALALGAFASTASAAATPAHAVSSHATAKHEYCAIMLAPPRPAHSTARIEKRTCSTQHAAGSMRPLNFSPAASVAIITGFQYTNFDPSGSAVTFYVASNCPSKSTTGWRLPDTRPSSLLPGQNWGISSWQAFNGCWATTLYYGLDFGAPKYQYAQGVWDAGQISAPWDNHVWSIWTGYKR